MNIYLFIYLFLARLTLASSKLNLCVKLMAKLPPECPCKEMHFIGGLHSLSTNKVNMMLSLYLGFILCQTVNNGYLFVYSDYSLLYIKKSEDYISFSAKQTLVCVCVCIDLYANLHAGVHVSHSLFLIGLHVETTITYPVLPFWSQQINDGH